MEQTNISLQYGIHRTPSLGNDGELSECVNLIPQNGELVNLQEPRALRVEGEGSDTELSLQEGEMLFFIHKVREGDHYIVCRDGTISFFTKDAPEERIAFGEIEGLKSCTAAGNILAAIGEKGLERWFWRDGAYRSLGTHLPELPIQFGLQTEYVGASPTIQVGSIDNRLLVGSEITRIDGTSTTSATIDAGRKGIINAISNQVFASLNSLIQNQCTGKERFGHPFFVVYAFRLFDKESYAMRSSPVLMTPYTIPQVEITGLTLDSNNYAVESISTHISMLAAKLDYAVLSQSAIDALNDWKDIISSVDIFVSKPLYFYDPSGDITTFFHRDAHEEKCGVPRATIGKYKYPEWIWPYRGTLDFQRPFSNEENTKFYNYDQYMPIGVADEAYNMTLQIRLPHKSAKDIETIVTSESLFYRIASIDIKKLTTTRTEVPIEKGTLEGLEGKTGDDKLLFDYYEHDTSVYRGGLSYNGRMILYGGERRSGVTNIALSALIPYTNAPHTETDGIPGNLIMRHSIDNGTLIDGMQRAVISWGGLAIPFIYLPDDKITAINLFYTGGNYSAYTGRNETFSTVQHDFLPGSYKYFGFGNIVYQLTSTSAPETTSNVPTFTEKDKVYVSEYDNPFVLRLSSSLTLNVGDIYAIASSAKALSQGQFGQFPLYAFTSDGIWALEIASDGAISAKQPVSRDVVTNPDSITQIDNAVVFVTNQGLKLISGSDVVLLSGPVEGLNVKESFLESPIERFAQKVGTGSPYVLDDTQFITQVQTANIVYDYAHNLLHVFHDKTSSPNKHYVYSFDTQQWASQVLDRPLVTAVPGYPLITMQFGNTLYQYDKLTEDTTRIGYALTRPLSLGDPLSRKALYDLRIVGQRTSAQTVRRVAIFVSNDNVNWHRLTSLKALSAKYYRFLIMTRMTDLDTISGLALQYDYRFRQKMRGH